LRERQYASHAPVLALFVATNIAIRLLRIAQAKKRGTSRNFAHCGTAGIETNTKTGRSFSPKW